MPLTARILARSGLPGPDILDLLTHLAWKPGDLALLHSAWNRGQSVLAAEPLLTVEMNAAGELRWIVHPPHRCDLLSLLHEPDPIRTSVGPDSAPLSAWQRMLDSVFLDDAAGRVPLVGWLGAVSYDLVHLLENIPPHATADLNWPLLRWTLFDNYFVFDHAARSWTVATMEYDAFREESADQRLDRMEHTLGLVELLEERTEATRIRSRMHAAMPRDTYLARIARIHEYIAAGDIYQANFAQRWTLETKARPELIYRRLCGISPAQFAAFYRFGERAILSASPELFLDRVGRRLVTRPIKGTRQRDLDDARHDEALRQELLASGKDKAELAMIVDLLRNDLGRVCEYGSVKVAHPRETESLPTVWHTTATVEGLLDGGAVGNDWAAVFAAMCPGGSVTGAPKIRAMQIIEELEPVRRAWYCGNLGWIGPHDTGGLNIAIRSILMEGPTAHVYAGGGIVADSDPAAEYAETLAKARPLLDALGVA